MNTFDIDRLSTRVIHRTDLNSPPTAPEYLEAETPKPSDNTALALEMVSETAAAIRYLEEQSAEAVARARDLAGAVHKKLESTEARAERAETAQREADAEAQELTAALARTRADLDIARQQIADKGERLAATEEHLRLTEVEVRDAEQRAKEANAAIEQILGAIRTQLPGREDMTVPIYAPV